MEAILFTLIMACLTGLGILAVLNYRRVLFWGALVFYGPIWIYLKIVEFEIQIFSWFNRHLFENYGIISKHMKTLTGLHVKQVRLSRDLITSIANFLGEEEMAVVIQPAGEVIEYVPEDQRDLPEHEQTVIEMKKMPKHRIVEERDKLIALSDKGRVEALRSASVSYQITKMQLSGWRNVVDKDGNDVPCDLSKRDSMYDLLPFNIQDELEAEFGGGLQVKEKDEADTTEQPE